MAKTKITDQPAAEGKVVGMYYTLKDETGAVLDTNRRGGRPMAFLVGAGNVLPAVEQGLMGKRKNDFVELDLSPGEGYGEHEPEAVSEVDLSVFEDPSLVQPGRRFSARDPQGRARSVLVKSVDGEKVTIDQNHPLAGRRLRFEITVCGVRDATPEETAHGHPHGPGGHQH
jgi:FKBP-type peptidyl-prolyl cis-trans isomerase SlyD